MLFCRLYMWSGCTLVFRDLPSLNPLIALRVYSSSILSFEVG